jgi:hypothetical protein
MEVVKRALPIRKDIGEVADQRVPWSISTQGFEVRSRIREDRTVGVLDNRRDKASDRGEDGVLDGCSLTLGQLSFQQSTQTDACHHECHGGEFEERKWRDVLY